MNPLRPLYDRFNHGDPMAKYNELPDFPRMIDIEPCGLCNMRCLMCPTGIQALGRPQDFMHWKTWERILEQCAVNNTAIRFIGWGEPTLHPDLIDWISQASAHGLMTHINTNGTKMSPHFAYALIRSGLSSIKFSFQGVDRESYKAMRRTDFFDELMEAISTLRQARGSKSLPFIAASTSTTTETTEAIARFVEIISPLVDELTLGKTIFGFIDEDKASTRQRLALDHARISENVEKRHPDPCPEVYDKLSIHWDGSVKICCNAYGNEGTIGNVNETSIAKLWRHPDMEAYRERLSRKNYEAPLCRDCWDYHDLTKGAA